MIRTARRLATALLVLASIAMLAPSPASAGPAEYYFAGSDFRYEQPYSCGSTSGTCWYVPYNSSSTAYVAHFNTQALTRASIREKPNGRLNGWGAVLVAGQGVRVMCWQTDSSGVVWLTLASAQLDPNGDDRVFAIGVVLDSAITLSRADRINYVPECGGVLV